MKTDLEVQKMLFHLDADPSIMLHNVSCGEVGILAFLHGYAIDTSGCD